jgi:hypothetical protein
VFLKSEELYKQQTNSRNTGSFRSLPLSKDLFMTRTVPNALPSARWHSLLPRRTLQDLLSLDPGNRQAIDLKAAVEHVLRRDGAIGLALLSTATAAVAALAVGAAVLKRR